MKITTPHGTLEGDNIEAILKEHGFHCLYDADLRYADLRGANLGCACLSKISSSTPTGGTNALQASTSSSPASKQPNTKEAPNEQ